MHLGRWAAISALLLSIGEALAADSVTCDAYVKEAVGKAQGVKFYNCGFDLADPRWSTDSDAHALWCKDADKDMVASELARRRGEIKLCQTCRDYAELAIESAADNAKFKCRFEGERWSGKADDHFGWCMARRARGDVNEKEVVAAYKTMLEQMQKPINVETGARVSAITGCRRPPAKVRRP